MDVHMQIAWPIRWSRIIECIIIAFFMLVFLVSGYFMYKLITGFDDRLTDVEQSIFDHSARQDFLEDAILKKCYPND